jgi:hypothetical protein
MSCAKQTFTGLTPDQFAALAAKGAASGLALSGNEGQAVKNGFTVTWNYDPAAGVLEIQCLSAPFLVPCSTINGRIHDLVDSVIATPPDPQAGAGAS